jgi:hypothetical protein
MFGRSRYWRRGLWRTAVSSDYTYIGPCRCGVGPHAFYLDRRGRICNVWDRISEPLFTEENLKGELEYLKAEKLEMKKRIEELEKLIENKEKKE